MPALALRRLLNIVFPVDYEDVDLGLGLVQHGDEAAGFINEATLAAELTLLGVEEQMAGGDAVDADLVGIEGADQELLTLLDL